MPEKGEDPDAETTRRYVPPLWAPPLGLGLSEGGGLMLWIMPGPAWGFRLERTLHDWRHAVITEEIHGEDHPGNQ